MKKYTYIFLSALLLFYGCGEPNPTEPITKSSVIEDVEYQIIDQTELGFESEVYSEIVIRNEQELKNTIDKYSNAENQVLVDKLLSLDLENNILVIISGNTVSESTIISLDSVYIDNLGQIQVDYLIQRKVGIDARVSSPAIAFLIKKQKDITINFNRRFDDEGTNPDLEGFATISENESIYTFDKWKQVFNSGDELKQWATEHNLTETDFIDGVDFDTEMVISVGHSGFLTGDRSYRITDVQQQGGRIIVSSAFEMIKLGPFSFVKANHFIKIKKTGLPIYFNPTVIVDNVKTWGGFYNEKYKIVSVEVTKGTDAEIKKVSSMAELFSVFEPTDDMNPSNMNVDFEFFDLLIVKSPTLNNKALDYKITYLFRDAVGIKGQVEVDLSANGGSISYDNYAFIKILKTNIPISTNFEVTIK